MQAAGQNQKQRRSENRLGFLIFSGVLAANQTLPNVGTGAVNEGRLVEQGISPKLDVNDHFSLYAAPARGFRFAGLGAFFSNVGDTRRRERPERAVTRR